MSTLVIARLTFFEAARRRILLAALALGILFLVVFGVGFHLISRNMESMLDSNLLELNEFRNFLLMAGLYVVKLSYGDDDRVDFCGYHLRRDQFRNNPNPRF